MHTEHIHSQLREVTISRMRKLVPSLAKLNKGHIKYYI